jgi:hypothetical protein
MRICYWSCHLILWPPGNFNTIDLWKSFNHFAGSKALSSSVGRSQCTQREKKRDIVDYYFRQKKRLACWHGMRRYLRIGYVTVRRTTERATPTTCWGETYYPDKTTGQPRGAPGDSGGDHRGRGRRLKLAALCPPSATPTSHLPLDLTNCSES